ncbi:MAG: cupin domain-containing protein [Acidimicrobiia bacterium]
MSTSDGRQRRPTVAHLGMVLAEPVRGDGVHWALDSSADLHANLVRLGPGGSIGDHLNAEVDVLIVAISGSGTLRVDGVDLPLIGEVVAHVPKGTRRSITAGPEGLAYLTVHRHRDGIGLGPTRVLRDAGFSPSHDVDPDEGGDPACWADELGDG